MTFPVLQDLHRQLGLRLRAHAGDVAFPESTVSLPTRDSDELSFIRLVVWCYVLVNESGRVAFRFLRELPPLNGSELLPEASYLRTWATHNLLPDKESDRKKLIQSWQWLKDACGTSSPSTDAEWQLCFQRLVAAAVDLVQKALSACEALSSSEDGPRLLEELGRRVERDWEAYRFDLVVADAATRLGFDGIDVFRFRARHLDSWRRVVAVADDGAIRDLLEQRIEKDLLDLMNGALPLPARELLGRLPDWQPAELAALMLAIRTSRLSKASASELLAEALTTIEATRQPRT